jgi:transcriptional regulator with GAF, ATPase, and Fis domain
MALWAEGSPAMRELLRTLDRVAKGDINVLILGETGVGKDVVAQQIHRSSKRAGGPFLRVNCANLGEQLLESELFGHEKGAFTGAVQVKPGLFEIAAGGTVFLDEVGELPPALQAKLLTVLEDRRVRRVGGVKEYPVDVRFVAATNRELGDEAARSTFRSDLYFRLNGVSLRVPPLRERPEEIPALAKHFLRSAARLSGRAEERYLTDSAVEALRAWPWPGNIRELRNVIDRAVLLTSGSTIAREHLRLEQDRRVRRPAPGAAPSAGPGPQIPPEILEHPQRKEIVALLEEFAGNQSRTAEALGISRNTLFARMRKYRIGRPRSKSY